MAEIQVYATRTISQGVHTDATTGAVTHTFRARDRIWTRRRGQERVVLDEPWTEARRPHG